MRLRLIALVVVLLLIPLAIVSLPARLIPRLLPADQLLLSGLSGSLLQGQAARAILQTPAGPLHLGRVQWRVHPLSVLTLSPTVTLHSEWAQQRASLRASGRGDVLRLSDLDGSFSAGLVRQFVPLAVDGQVQLLFSELVLDAAGPLSAEGQVVWQNALWQSPGGGRPLGTYVAEITSTGERQLSGRVDTLSGPVLATGDLSLDANTYGVNMLVTGRNRNLEPALAQALSLLAAPENSGYRLRLSGELAPQR